MKITILTKEEVAQAERLGRKRVIFKQMLNNGRLKSQRFENKKRKSEKSRLKKESRGFKRDYS